MVPLVEPDDENPTQPAEGLPEDPEVETIVAGEEPPAEEPPAEEPPSPKPEPAQEDEGMALRQMLADSLEEGLALARTATVELSVKLLAQVHQTVDNLLNVLDLPEAQAQQMLGALQAAEIHALAGRPVQSEQALRRALNFVRSHAVVKKSQAIEQTESFLTSALSTVGSAVHAFITKFGQRLNIGEALDMVAQLVGFKKK